MQDQFTIHHGDCADVLKTLPENSIDAIVTDPPAGISFMGKEWDHHKGGRAEWVAWLASIMTEATRALKPGGHALVWALPRTSHWTATALEDAGLEIRDVITHHFATGFPKGLNVSKAIDAQAGAEREVVGKYTGTMGGFGDHRMVGSGDVTVPATDDARKWDGWKTALKPATEHWILCRKPITGTVAANVVQHGTGALNIDGCRIATGVGEIQTVTSQPREQSIYSPLRTRPTTYTPDKLGRYPSNVVWTCVCEGPHLDGCPVGELERQSGVTSGREEVMFKAARPPSRAKGADYGHWTRGIGDSGTAARFFYVAKPSRAERDAGTEENTHPTVKAIELMRYLCRLITPPGGVILDPFMGSGSTGCAAIAEGFRFIGIEREEEYVTIARARISHHASTMTLPL